MDFAKLMKSQISASQPKDGGAAGEKKYLKRSELEAQRQANYLREQEELEKARLERLEKKRKRDEEDAERNRAREEKKLKLAEESRKRDAEEKEAEERERRKRLGLPGLPATNDERDGTPLKDGEDDLGEEEVLGKLLELGEPRRLFGETHVQRLRRYRKLTSKALAPAMSKGPIPTSIELVQEADMKVPATFPQDPDIRRYLLRQIASYFDMVLSEWQNALARRTREVKESYSGKQAQNNFLAARDNLIPLFRKLEAALQSSSASSTASSSSKNKAEPIPDELLAPVHEIVHLAQLKRYVHANDAYLRLSIGKAAWPIGVTMVGIHERSAREKLHESDNKAHIMSDETTRKLLQGMKRCLSFAQTRWPPEDAGQIMG